MNNIQQGTGKVLFSRHGQPIEVLYGNSYPIRRNSDDVAFSRMLIQVPMSTPDWLASSDEEFYNKHPHLRHPTTTVNPENKSKPFSEYRNEDRETQQEFSERLSGSVAWVG